MGPRTRKVEIESALDHRLRTYLNFRERPAPEAIPTGIPEIDLVCGGLPRGAITEVLGPASSGRTSLLLSALKEATARQEACALVDAGDAFDPLSAAAAGVEFRQFLWVRCGGNLDHALKSADLLLQGGGFGLVALDLAELAANIVRSIPLAAWFRFRRAIENTPTVCLVIEREPTAASCTSLVLEMSRGEARWTGWPDCAPLLRGVRLRAVRRKPGRAFPSAFRNPHSEIFEVGALG